MRSSSWFLGGVVLAASIVGSGCDGDDDTTGSGTGGTGGTGGTSGKGSAGGGNPAGKAGMSGTSGTGGNGGSGGLHAECLHYYTCCRNGVVTTITSNSCATKVVATCSMGCETENECFDAFSPTPPESLCVGYSAAGASGASGTAGVAGEAGASGTSGAGGEAGNGGVAGMFLN